MKKLFTFLTMLLLGIGSSWAESKISQAVAGTSLFDSSNPALTVNKGGATITSNDGAIIIHHDDLSIVSGTRTYAAVVMKVDMPTTAPGTFQQFINLKTSSNDTGSIGLGVTTEGKLKGTWQATTGGYGPETSSAVTGEHIVVLLCNNSGTTIYVDDVNTSVNANGLKCGTKWTDLRIESAYTSCIKSVYVLSGEQSGNISTFFSELSNVVTVANAETKSVSDNSTATRFFVASGGTLTVDAAYDMDKIEGAGDVTIAYDTSLSGGISSIATGKLIINPWKTLTLGNGDSETNSLESFTSIVLSGTIKHNNSAATLCNVTVPENQMGVIFAYDMGDAEDGFKLSGTTTLNNNSTLFVLCRENLQMKIEKIAGKGGLLVNGTTGDVIAEGTSSKGTATINVADATTYTGEFRLNNDKATLNLAGSLVGSTWTKTNGTLNYTGTNLDGTTLDGVVLAGTSRISTSGTINIKNLAGNNVDDSSQSTESKKYTFVGSSGTINFYGICNLTKHADGETDCNSARVGYGPDANIFIKNGATVTAMGVYNSVTGASNGTVTVETNATLNAVATNATNQGGYILSKELINNGTISVATDDAIKYVVTLKGTGEIILQNKPSSTEGPTFDSSWTGVVEFPAMTSEGNLKGYFEEWGNTSSTIRLHNTTGWLPNETINRNLYVIENANFNLNNGGSNNNTTIKQISGNGTVTLTKWSNGINHKLIISTLKNFDSDKLKLVGGNSVDFPIVVENIVCETKPACGEKLFATSNYVTVNNLTVNSQPDNDYQFSVLHKGENNEGVYITGIDVTSGFYTIQSKNTSFNNYYLSLNMNTSSETVGIPYNGIQLVNERQLDYGDIWYIKYHGVSSEFSSEGSDTEKVYQLWSLKNGWGLSCMNPVLSSSINPRIYTLVSQSGGDVLIQGVSFEGTADVEQFGLSSSAGIANHKPLYPESATSIKRADAQSGEGSHWLLTKLTQIPFTFNSNALGYATFNCPVDVQVPDDVDAYVCRRNGTQLTLFKIENITTKDDDDNDVPTIPANTPVLLYNSNYTKNPTVQFKTTTLDEEVEVEGNGFYGTVGAKAYDESYSWYSLQKSGDNMGFFKKSSGTLNGFKAWVRVSDTSARQLTIVFDGESDPTGIVEALGLEDENVEIFDLNGRKLSSYQKGINIVNGKKVMVP